MKNKHLLPICLAALVAAAGTDGFAGSSLKAPVAVYAADDTNDDWLHCEGSRIFDKDGNEVWLTGANWFGFNCTECSGSRLLMSGCSPFRTQSSGAAKG